MSDNDLQVVIEIKSGPSTAQSVTVPVGEPFMVGRLDELRGLPVDVWEATSRIVPAQLTWDIGAYRHRTCDPLTLAMSQNLSPCCYVWFLVT